MDVMFMKAYVEIVKLNGYPDIATISCPDDCPGDNPNCPNDLGLD